MKFKPFYQILLLGFVAVSTLTFNACKEDDEPLVEPTISLSETSFTGKTGETATVTATAVATEGFKSITITKYIGTDIDATYGTNGSKTVTTESTTETYELNAEGLANPVRFNFVVEDNEGQTASADYIVTTEASVSYLLTTYNWQWKSKMGKCLDTEPESEMIEQCETDNIYIFNADGTMSIDYGAMTGSGGGTCDFDGVKPPTDWSLNADESELTIISTNVFDPNDIQTEIYRIQSANTMAIKSEQTVDLTVFGCVVWDWKFEWTAVAK